MLRPALLVLALGTALSLASSRADAQDLPAAPPPPPGATPPAAPALLPAPAISDAWAWKDFQAQQAEPTNNWSPNNWYGWQTLLIALPCSIMYFGGYSIDDYRERDTARNLMLIGFTGQLFAGPIVHWGHGYAGKGWASFGIGLGAPLALASLTFFASLEHNSNRDDIPDDYAPDLAMEDAQLVLGLGALVWTGIDAAWLSSESREETKPRGSALSRALPVSFAVAPMLDKERLGLSVAGRF